MNAAAVAWIGGDDTGTSSKAIWSRMVNAPIRRGMLGNWPHDPDDFGRCYRLLRAVPEWHERIGEMADVSPEWAALAEHWSELEALYEKVVGSGRGWNLPAAERMYARMRALIDGAQKAGTA